MDSAEGDFKEARLKIKLKERQPLEIEQLREAVVKAGFTPAWIRFGATGRLVQRDDHYGLIVEDVGQVIDLLKNEKLKALLKTAGRENKMIEAVAIFPKGKQKAKLEEFQIHQGRSPH